MDLLSSAYSSGSDEEEAQKSFSAGPDAPASHHGLNIPYGNTAAESFSPSTSEPTVFTKQSAANPVTQTHRKRKDTPGSQPVIGYVSKRKKKEQSTSQPLPHVNVLAPYHTSSSNTSDDVCEHVKHSSSSLPRHKKHTFTEHSKPVLSTEWHPGDPCLLLSASLDGDLRLWDVEKESCLTSYSLHGGAAVRDVKWVTNESAVSAGYDRSAVYVDAGYGKEIARLKHSAYVSVATNHLSNPNTILTGDFNGKLQLWDLRSSQVVKYYKGAGGKILDAMFLPAAEMFVASSDIVKKNAYSQAMNVWDVASGVTLAHQLYFEPFSCPCLRTSRNGEEFLAQSNGNYVVVFSAKSPFKMNKRKRFQGHYVSGFDVGFDLNADGTVLCSASSEGKVHFYDYFSARVIRTMTLTDSACLSVAWNQKRYSQVAVSDWEGKIHILE